MESDKIMERLVAVEVKCDLILQQVREHGQRHFQINLMLFGTLLTSVAAVVVAVMV